MTQGRRRARAFLSPLALLVLVGCAEHAPPREPPGRAPDVFGDLLEGSALAVSEEAASRFRAAWQALEDGDLATARRGFEAIRERPPAPLPETGLYPVDTALGAVRLAAGDLKGALREFSLALDRKPAYAEALVGQAAVLHEEGDDVRAIDVLDRVLAMKPAHAGARSLRARATVRLQEGLEAEVAAAETRGDVAAALDRSAALVALLPGDAAARKREGRLALAAGDARRAVNAYGEAVRLDPEDAEAWIGLGESHAKAGETAPAREAYERAAKLPGGLERAQEHVRALRERTHEVPSGGAPASALTAAARIDRAGLATLLVARLPGLASLDRAREPVIVTDIWGTSARAAIQDAIAVGAMDVYDNHTFRPETPVTRAMLARTVAAVLQGLRRSGLLSERRYDPREIADLPPEHLAYADVVEALRYGVLELDPEGAFGPGEVVSGAEADRALERLARLAR